MEEVDLEGFDTNFGVGGVGMEENGRGGAIVAFEGMFGWGRIGGAGFGALRFVGRRHSALVDITGWGGVWGVFDGETALFRETFRLGMAVRANQHEYPAR